MTMAMTRRAALAGAAALAASSGWAEAGAPAFLAAARRGDGAWRLVGLREDGAQAFDLPLPGRGHAAAAHPHAPLAVAFARRPGRFALVIDCAAGREAARLSPPPARSFAGHGAFSADGATLFTAENADDLGEGRVGVWETAGWRRLGEFPTGGVGPHEMILAPGGGALVVANGGILTHPDSGRAKLNIPTMRPNLARLAADDGALIALVEPEPALRKNSLRHIAVAPDGVVAVAAQWEGDLREDPPLLALWRPGAEALAWLRAPGQARLKGYAGSCAMSRDGGLVAITGPRGGLALAFPTDGGAAMALEGGDICGAAPAGDGFAFTTGDGAVLRASVAGGALSASGGARYDGAFDNHLVAL